MVVARGRIRPELIRRTRPTKRGVAFLAVGMLLFVLAYGLRRPELQFIGVFVVAAPLMALVLVSLQRPLVDVHRTFVPATVTAGQTTTVRVDLHNRGPRPLPATTWRDFCGWAPRRSATGHLGALRSGLRRTREPRSFARLSYELVPPRRGQFEIGPFTITLTDPFGLASGTQLASHAQTVTVVPQTLVLPDSGLAIAEADGSARLVQHRAVGGDHDISTRAYRTGDALRRVHWRASAHHGDLMVRQEEQRSHSEASILLDTRRDGYEGARSWNPLAGAESDSFEWAVAFTASLVVHLQRSGFLVHLHESADVQLASPQNTTLFLESLATVSLSSIPVPIGTVLAGDRQQSSRTPGSLFAIVSNADDELVDGLADRRGLFELAVAFIVMPRRDQVIDVLSRAGWICVVVKPGDTAQDAWLAVTEGAANRHGSNY